MSTVKYPPMITLDVYGIGKYNPRFLIHMIEKSKGTMAHNRCNYCNDVFESRKQQHINTAHPICILCEHKASPGAAQHFRYNTVELLQNHIKEQHFLEFARPAKFFCDFLCIKCNSGWKSAKCWGVFSPYPRNTRCDSQDDYLQEQFSETNGRIRYQTSNKEGVWGEIFICFPQKCRNCQTLLMPMKCTYLTCSVCNNDVRHCDCPKNRSHNQYDPLAPHRTDLCSRCSYLGHPCWYSL